jgi:hypothetical protein
MQLAAMDAAASALKDLPEAPARAAALANARASFQALVRPLLQASLTCPFTSRGLNLFLVCVSRLPSPSPMQPPLPLHRLLLLLLVLAPARRPRCGA